MLLDTTTMNQNFTDMLEYTNGKFLGLKLNTNASLLTEKMAHALLSSDLQTIVFSIDSKDKEAYEKIRINGNFEKVVANLERFNHIRNTQYSRSDKVVRISGVKINDNQDIDEMRKKWGDVADIVKQNKVGIVVEGKSNKEMKSAYKNLITLFKDPNLSSRCRSTSEKLFSLEIYKNLF